MTNDEFNELRLRVGLRYEKVGWDSPAAYDRAWRFWQWFPRR